jgi:CheY-like chemotaxis protein
MNKNFTILLAEDSEDDVWLVKRALNWADIHNPVHIVHDGQEAIDYLAGKNGFADRQRYPLPQLALLDIKMPRKDGLEVLDWLRNDAEEGLSRLPVIIMSSSNRQEDIDRAYQAGVNAYLVKPNAFNELVDALKTTTDFWKDTVAQPRLTT